MEKTVAQKIKERIEKSLILLGCPNPDGWQVYASERTEHGHYATNVAMVLAQGMKRPPLEMAKQISESLRPEFKTEVVKPGFINFFLASEQLHQEWQTLVDGSKDQIRTEKPKKIQIEFVSANPTGPLTLGNGRGGFFGDVLGNILAKAGHQVTKEYYINNAGFQVQRLGESVLGYPGASYRGEYIEELKKIIKTKDVTRAGQEAADHILDKMIRPDIEKIGISFDVWFSERDLYEKKMVQATLDLLKTKDLTQKKAGALWLKTTRLGDDKDRALVKSTGEMTYLMTDLAYHLNKFRRGFDLVIDIWGADHQGHIEPLLQGLDSLGAPVDGLKILIAQWVKVIKGGREMLMSKRRGEYVTITELVDQIGLDAVRFFFLNRSLNSHLNFDFDLAVKKSSENPVYYIQYAHARMNSIMEKIKRGEAEIDLKTNFVLSHPSEQKIIMELLHYPEVINNITETYDVHKLPQYAYSLASAWHSFYQDCSIIDSIGQEQPARLALMAAAKKTLKESLALMGISAPDKM